MSLVSRKVMASVVLFAALPAAAQNIAATRAAESQFSAPAALRVQVSIQINTPASGGNEDVRKAMEAARRHLYDSANGECAILSEAFKAECRLTIVNVNSSLQERGSMGQSIYSHGNMTYELVPRGR